MEAKSTVALLLAAGESKRLGRPKQLLPYQGRTLLTHTFEELKVCCEDVLVITGAHREAVEAILPVEANVLWNPNWKQGMGSTIAMGVKDIINRTGVETILISTCDQPGLGRLHFKELLKTAEKKEGAATNYGKRGGVPAVFCRSVWSALIQLEGDKGARDLINSEQRDIEWVQPIGSVFDIDTEEDFLKLTRNPFQD